MRIIADTATLLTPEEGEKLGVTIIPVSVALNGHTYRDYADITSEDFLRLVEAGGTPTSSQPSLGEILEVYEDSGEEALFLTVGDGLSGAYQTAVAARSALADGGRIHVVNSKTLAGPLRHLARKAAALRSEGRSLPQILTALEPMIESSRSFVIPANFEFLRRSGRLTPIAAKIGGVLKLLPVLTQTSSKTRIRPVTIKRTWKSAVSAVMQQLKEADVGADHLISICHAGTPDHAQSVASQVQKAFPDTEIEILLLSPALITHGGPGCIVIQSVLK